MEMAIDRTGPGEDCRTGCVGPSDHAGSFLKTATGSMKWVSMPTSCAYPPIIYKGRANRNSILPARRYNENPKGK